MIQQLIATWTPKNGSILDQITFKRLDGREVFVDFGKIYVGKGLGDMHHVKLGSNVAHDYTNAVVRKYDYTKNDHHNGYCSVGEDKASYMQTFCLMEDFRYAVKDVNDLLILLIEAAEQGEGQMLYSPDMWDYITYGKDSIAPVYSISLKELAKLAKTFTAQLQATV